MNKQLKISIVICTYNRQQYLQKALEHLKDQSADYPCYEVVVIDNNSPDDSENICREFIHNHPALNILYFKEMQQGHTYARNRGIQESRGTYIAFIDDDAYVQNDFVSNIISYFDQNPKTMAIGGKILPIYESKKPDWMSRYLLPLVSALDMGEEVRLFKGSKYPIGANMAYRRSTFDRYGLFNTDFGRKGTGLEGGDEKELLYRLKGGNEKIYYVPSVVVEHIIPEKRLRLDYIKRLALGVGTTERRRVIMLSFFGRLGKIWEEGYKMAGTIIISLAYCLTLQFSKASMLIRFRFWVWQGLLRG